MAIAIDRAALNLAVALGLSAVIGFERQWRNRLAGLRTHTLVALAAAACVIFEQLVEAHASPTAATLWCSAAIGTIAGAGYALYAAIATGSGVSVDCLLRPIDRFINRQPLTSTELETGYRVSATWRSPHEAQVRALLPRRLAGRGLTLRHLDSTDLEGCARVLVTAFTTASHRVETIVGWLSLEPTVSAARWQAETRTEQENPPSLEFGGDPCDPRGNDRAATP